jgi:PIN domain nuclease of toxin-antitoxin system
MVALELIYLHETGRITAGASDLLDDARRALGLVAADESFAAVTDVAQTLDWTRDPFDRIIAAQALTARARLLTKDATIRDHLGLAVW